MKKIFSLLFLCFLIFTITGCTKGKDVQIDKAAVPFSTEERITQLVEAATGDKKIQQEMREELRFFLDQGYSSIGWVSIAYNPILNDFEYRFEGDIGMSRFKLQEEMQRKFGIYFEDKEAPTEIIEVRDVLYKLFEKLSRRVVVKEGVLPKDCSDGCRKVVYKMYPMNQIGILNNQFALVDFVVNKKTTNTLSVSFQHLGFYYASKQPKPKDQILNVEELRAEFVKENDKRVISTISLYEPYAPFNWEGEHYYSKDSLFSNR